MEFLKHCSWLQLYWIVQGLAYLLLTFKCLLTGKYWNKGEHHSVAKLKWWQFRRRRSWYNLVAVISTTIILFYNILATSFHFHFMPRLEKLQHWLTDPSPSYIDAPSCLIGGSLYLCHAILRTYQSIFISVHSRKQVLGPFEVALSYVNEVAVGFSIVAECQKPWLVDSNESLFEIKHLRLGHIVAVILFVVASSVQMKTFHHFTLLRKNKAGHVVTTAYKPPNKGPFERLNVSNPHYFSELLIHISILISLGLSSWTWTALTFHVTCHLTYLAYVTHRYYVDKFGDVYPKHRKMFVPWML